MKNKQYEELALQAGGSHYPSVGGNTLELFATLVVEACISAVENTDTTHAFTTFDKGIVDATIEKCAKSIRDSLGAPLTRKMPHEDSISK